MAMILIKSGDFTDLKWNNKAICSTAPTCQDLMLRLSKLDEDLAGSGLISEREYPNSLIF